MEPARTVQCDPFKGAVKASMVSRVSRLPSAVAIGLVCLAITGCSMTGKALEDVATTNSISMAEPTPSIAVDPFAPRGGNDGGETDRLIDEDTIRLAVTTADIDRLEGGSLPWASAATGSSGAITGIVQTEQSGQTCRSFSATRNAYDGSSLYQGEVCLDPRSGWWTRAMAPVSAGSSIAG